MGLLNRLRGEEPGYFRKLSVQRKEGAGGLGEYLTEYALEHGNLPGRRAVFRNVLVPRSSGPTSESEVDVLMLHETGVYVMESKNYGGWIFGSAEQDQWTQTLEGGAKERFYNPIIQNRAHVKALAACLGLPEEAFRSYIVFSERCELKKVPEDTGEFAICQRQHSKCGNIGLRLNRQTRLCCVWNELWPCAILVDGQPSRSIGRMR